ncbi:hypothetical protein Cni_G03466 [Canna indica]|uniref:Uncharacterized protein n=1 Tax=Canna indica TaxID=4628 RepID=A0AAQ3JRC2_9LILI|nr:hypothetical protein Cni_G03466 [Canna indica]
MLEYTFSLLKMRGPKGITINFVIKLFHMILHCKVALVVLNCWCIRLNRWYWKQKVQMCIYGEFFVKSNLEHLVWGKRKNHFAKPVYSTWRTFEESSSQLQGDKSYNREGRTYKNVHEDLPSTKMEVVCPRAQSVYQPVVTIIGCKCKVCVIIFQNVVLTSNVLSG